MKYNNAFEKVQGFYDKYENIILTTNVDDDFWEELIFMKKYFKVGLEKTLYIMALESLEQVFADKERREQRGGDKTG